ncbi:conserved protein of unknown function [Candidatus Hydrogenisulfobacillus filiaventi]|uniref:Uncharacterized protein n=1 Tax=Candidatus Hydrogenisulfobacillus filiaventi TaxID=2707344 RepID=A0A6F8ZF37_9FIRM|nr:conserved protein of unknown function [Candidatus Hydrogenisulfobacillus filiaventi]
MIAIARLADEARAEQMGQLFQTLLGLPPEQQREQMQALIGQMAEQATDAEYLALCRTNMTLAAQLPEPVLQGFLDLRRQAVAALPAAWQERDQRLLMEAFRTLPESVQAPIGRVMGL